MSAINDILGAFKPIIETYTEGQPIHKFLVKAGIKRATKLTPNLSKSMLYMKSNRTDLFNAFVKLLTGNDELSKQFRLHFSEICKNINLKTSILVDEKSKIAKELNKQDEQKEDIISKLSNEDADKIVDKILDKEVEKENGRQDNTVPEA